MEVLSEILWIFEQSFVYHLDVTFFADYRLAEDGTRTLLEFDKFVERNRYDCIVVVLGSLDGVGEHEFGE